jgi:tetratricopeptide (TPR) repeat protein
MKFISHPLETNNLPDPILLAALGHHDVALEALNKAIDINPDDYLSRGSKAMVLIKLHHYDEAQEETGDGA